MSQKRLYRDLKRVDWQFDFPDCIKFKIDGATIEAELDEGKVAAAVADFAAVVLSEALYEIDAIPTEKGIVISWFFDSGEMRRTIPWAEAACLNPEKDALFLSDSAGHLKLAKKLESIAKRLRHLAETADRELYGDIPPPGT